MVRNKQRGLSTPAFIGVVVLIGIVIVVGAVFIGKSDGGEINVSDAIENSNRERVDQGGDPNDSVPTTPKNLRDLPNGGLVPMDTEAPTPKPAPEPEEEVSTTTEEDNDTSTSTEEESET